MVDITERKRINDELIASELRYHTLFDWASNVIYLHDISKQIFLDQYDCLTPFGFFTQGIFEYGSA